MKDFDKISSVKLTQKQALSFIGGKHWSQKQSHLIKLAKNYNIKISNDDELRYLIEVHVPNELKRIRKQYFIDSQTGKIKTNLTPTDIKGDFKKVTRPVIGVKYHISWAFSGAVFVLKKIEGEICYLDNPKHKRKSLITCKISELRCVRSKK